MAENLYEKYLRDTITFFGEDPRRRAVADSGGCVYRLIHVDKPKTTEKQCAVARLCNTETLDFFHGSGEDIETCLAAYSIMLDDDDPDTPGEPRTADGLPFLDNPDFWEELQGMHDWTNNWALGEHAPGTPVRHEDVELGYAAREYLTLGGLVRALKCCRYAGIEPGAAIPGWSELDETVYQTGRGVLGTPNALRAAYQEHAGA